MQNIDIDAVVARLLRLREVDHAQAEALARELGQTWAAERATKRELIAIASFEFAGVPEGGHTWWTQLAETCPGIGRFVHETDELRQLLGEIDLHELIAKAFTAGALSIWDQVRNRI